MPVQPDFDTVHKALRWLLPVPDRVIEIRTIEQYRGRACVGYFNDPVVAANAVVHGDAEKLTGSYVTLNPVHPAAFARCSNRMMSAGAGNYTKDKEIVERRGLLLDFDPKRPKDISGISSTDEEHLRALTHMQGVAEDLTLWHGFPIPCLIDSGNGGHVKYMLDPLPNDPETTALIRMFLKCCDELYKNPFVDIDQSVFNASRIVRIPGTPARKGEDSWDRPHRVSRIIRDYDPLDTLSRSTLERFVNRYQHLTPDKPRTTVDLAIRARSEYPPDEQIYRKLNRIAKERYHDWVPYILGELVFISGNEYRISSDTLGRDLEEAIRIGPWGIKDQGVADMGDETEGRRQAVTLIAELITDGNKRRAAELLSITLDVSPTDFGEKLIMPPIEPLMGDTPILMPESLLGTPGFDMPKNGYSDVDLLGMGRTEWLVPSFVIDCGYTVLSAPTKMGKSTLTKQLFAACLTGTEFLGHICPKIEVLYISYEDMVNDIIPDMRHLLGLIFRERGVPEQEIPGEVAGALKGFHYYAREQDEAGEFFHRVPTGRGGLDFIADLVSSKLPRVRLTGIDPIRLLRDETVRSRDIVTQQYYEGLDFVNLAIKGKTAVWGLHHNNKESGKKMSEGNDPLLSAGGTAAVLGSAQNAIVFEGDRIPEGVDGANGLYISPRIGQTRRKVIKYHEGRFYQAPSDTEVYYHRNNTQQKTADPQIDLKILTYLEQHVAVTGAQISEALNVQKYTIDRRLELMKEKGIVDVSKDVAGLFYKGKGAPPKVWTLNKAINLPKLD